jgi:tetratricopeptide (TPR) repeat protein
MNHYFIKAWDNYPYNLLETVENLEYAVSTDVNNPLIYVLYGRMYAEQFKDYTIAINYFQEAMEKDINCTEIYSHYITTLLWNEDFNEAENLIEFAFKIKSIDKAALYFCKIQLFECQKRYTEAMEIIKLAKIEGYNDEFMSNLNQLKERIKKKIKLTQPKKKKKNKEKVQKNNDISIKEKKSFFSKIFQKKSK